MVGLLFLSFGGLLGLASLLNYNLYWNNFLGSLVKNHDLMYALSLPGDRIEFNHLQPTLLSLGQNLPLALVSGLFRPFIWECTNMVQLWNGLENLLLLVLSGLALFQNRKKSFSALSSATFLLSLATGLYILLLAAVLAFSTPNFGTLVRYKVAYLPFLIYLLASSLPLDQWLLQEKD